MEYNIWEFQLWSALLQQMTKVRDQDLSIVSTPPEDDQGKRSGPFYSQHSYTADNQGEDQDISVPVVSR